MDDWNGDIFISNDTFIYMIVKVNPDFIVTKIAVFVMMFVMCMVCTILYTQHDIDVIPV
jgi:hypothetical protein